MGAVAAGIFVPDLQIAVHIVHGEGDLQVVIELAVLDPGLNLFAEALLICGALMEPVSPTGIKQVQSGFVGCDGGQQVFLGFEGILIFSRDGHRAIFIHFSNIWVHVVE